MNTLDTTKGTELMDLVKTLQGAASNPAVRDAVARGLEVRDSALRTQAAMLSAMNLPSADELASIAKLLRSISQRLELLEDAVAQVDDKVSRVDGELRALRALRSEIVVE